jgi:hypothetical protein
VCSRINLDLAGAFPASSLLMHGAANHLQANFLDHAIVSMI